MNRVSGAAARAAAGAAAGAAQAGADDNLAARLARLAALIEQISSGPWLVEAVQEAARTGEQSGLLHARQFTPDGEELTPAASPGGPWHWQIRSGWTGFLVAGIARYEDAAFIQQAREAITFLAASFQSLQARVAALEKAVRQAEADKAAEQRQADELYDLLQLVLSWMPNTSTVCELPSCAMCATYGSEAYAQLREEGLSRLSDIAYRREFWEYCQARQSNEDTGDEDEPPEDDWDDLREAGLLVSYSEEDEPSLDWDEPPEGWDFTGPDPPEFGLGDEDSWDELSDD